MQDSMHKTHRCPRKAMSSVLPPLAVDLSHTMQFKNRSPIFADRNDNADESKHRLESHGQRAYTGERGNSDSSRPLDAASGIGATCRASRCGASGGTRTSGGASRRRLAGGCGESCLCDAGNAAGKALVEGLSKLELVGLEGFEAAGNSDGNEEIGAGDGGHGCGGDASGRGVGAAGAPCAVGSVAGDDAALLEGAVDGEKEHVSHQCRFESILLLLRGLSSGETHKWSPLRMSKS